MAEANLIHWRNLDNDLKVMLAAYSSSPSLGDSTSAIFSNYFNKTTDKIDISMLNNALQLEIGKISSSSSSGSYRLDTIPINRSDLDTSVQGELTGLRTDIDSKVTMADVNAALSAMPTNQTTSGKTMDDLELDISNNAADISVLNSGLSLTIDSAIAAKLTVVNDDIADVKSDISNIKTDYRNNSLPIQLGDMSSQLQLYLGKLFNTFLDGVIDYGYYAENPTVVNTYKTKLYTPIYDISTGIKYTYSSGSWTTDSNALYNDYKSGKILVDKETKKYYIFDGSSSTDVTQMNLGSYYGICSTAAATANKTLSISGFNLNTGTSIYIKFNNAVQAGATLNINNTGNKAIIYKNANIIAGKINANDTAHFVYSGSSYVLMGIDTI